MSKTSLLLQPILLFIEGLSIELEFTSDVGQCNILSTLIKWLNILKLINYHNKSNYNCIVCSLVKEFNFYHITRIYWILAVLLCGQQAGPVMYCAFELLLLSWGKNKQRLTILEIKNNILIILLMNRQIDKLLFIFSPFVFLSSSLTQFFFKV